MYTSACMHAYMCALIYMCMCVCVYNSPILMWQYFFQFSELVLSVCHLFADLSQFLPHLLITALLNSGKFTCSPYVKFSYPQAQPARSVHEV